jgi:hypothetical protein
VRPGRQPVSALAPVLFVCAALAGHAESQLRTVGNLFVFYAPGPNGAPTLNVVSAEDGAPLKVIGRVPLASSKAIHAQSSFEDQIILLLWDEVEVYSLAEPSAPKRVAAYPIRSQIAGASGNPRIEATAERRFLIISPVGAGELVVDPAAKRWSLTDVEMTPALQQKARTQTPEEESAGQALVSDRDSGRPRVLKESARFRYERLWKRRTKPGLIVHLEYLRKVDKVRGKTVAELLLGEELETID